MGSGQSTSMPKKSEKGGMIKNIIYKLLLKLKNKNFFNFFKYC